MNREEISKKICANNLVNCDYDCDSYEDKICDECKKIADWHISEVALAERKARVEVANEIQEQLIIDIPQYAYGDSEGGSALASQLNNAAIYCNQIIIDNSEPKGE